MRRTRQTAPGTYILLVRSILAAALVCCVLSSALPAEAALNPNGLMPCCRGMQGTAGECHGDSCPMHLGALKKPLRVVQHDPVCGAERLLQAIAGTPVQTPQDYLEQGPLHQQTQAEVEHEHGRGVSPRNIPRQQSAGAVALGKSCPSDCCGGAEASFAGLRRPRQAAALTDVFRSHAPNVRSHSSAPSGLIKVTSALRRSHPPRAPPTASDSRTA